MAAELRLRGNEYLKQSRALGIPPSVAAERLRSAVQCYQSGLALCENVDERVVIHRNLTISLRELAENEIAMGAGKEAAADHAVSALQHAVWALQDSSKDQVWCVGVGEIVVEAVQQCVGDGSSLAGMNKLAGGFEGTDISGSRRKVLRKAAGLCYTHLAGSIFKQAVLIRGDEAQTDKYIATVQEAEQVLRRAEGCEEFLSIHSAELSSVRSDIQFERSLAQSTHLRMVASQMVTHAVSDPEEMDMDLLWIAVDRYLLSIHVASQSALESEAISRFQFGCLLEDCLKLPDVAHDQYQTAHGIGVSMTVPIQPGGGPGVPITGVQCKPWFIQCRDRLGKSQLRRQLALDAAQAEKERPIMEALKSKLDLIKAEADKGVNQLITHLLTGHPPIVAKYKPADKPVVPDGAEDAVKRKALFKLLVWYSPDKQPETATQEWNIFVREICKVINGKYMTMSPCSAE